MFASTSISALSLSLATSGYSESVDFEIVDEILERSPREATTFPLVYKAYTEVLQENGISAQDDTAYYQFLLKLGVIRARTWGDRWDLWRATHGQHASLPIRHQPTPPSPQIPNHAAARAASAKAKLPFLASASSDLDEGFAPTLSAHSGDADGETETEGQVVGSLGYARRSSPRKALGADARVRAPVSDGTGTRLESQHLSPRRASSSRSLVGYTPSPRRSQVHSFQAPVRNSTPASHQVHIRTRRSSSNPITPQNGSHPTPPPYTESDASHSVSGIADGVHAINLTADDIAMIDGLTAPRVRSRSIRDNRLIEVDRDSYASSSETGSNLDSEMEEQRIIRKEARNEMDRRAEEFYRTGVVGRCWDTWRQSHAWVNNTTRQIDTVRQAILLRQTVRKWQNRTIQVLEAPNTADGHRRAHLQNAVLKRWGEKLKEARLERKLSLWKMERNANQTHSIWLKWRGQRLHKDQQRYRAGLVKKEKRFVQDRDKQLLLDALGRWRGETRTRSDERTADSFFKARIFAQWIYRTEQHQRLEGQITVWEVTKRKRDLTENWSTWTKATELHSIERGLVQSRDTHLAAKVLDSWLRKAKDERKAKQVDQKRLLRSVMDKWKNRKLEIARMQRRAYLFIKHADSSLLHQTISVWIASERGKLLVRVRDQRLVSQALATWKSASEHVRQMEAEGEAFHLRSGTSLKTQAFAALRNALEVKRTQARQAASLDDFRIKTIAMHRWKNAVEEKRADELSADAARVFFLQRESMTAWKVGVGKRRQERFVAEKEGGLLRAVFDHWLLISRKGVEGRRAADAFLQRSDNALLSQALTHWTTRCVIVKSRELEVLAQRHRDQKHLALTLWRSALTRVKGGQNLAQSFLDLRDEDRLRDVLLSWREAARGKKERRELLRTVLEDKRKEMMRRVWDEWRGRLVERRLLPLEQEVALRREDAILFSVWDKWKANASQLPAVSFNNRRIKQQAFDRIRRAFESAQSVRDFSMPRETQLLAEAFDIWRYKAIARTVARVGRVRGRVRPSLGSAAGTVPTHTPAQNPIGTRAHRPNPPSNGPALAKLEHRRSHTVFATPQVSDSRDDGNPRTPAYLRLREELESRRKSLDEAGRASGDGADRGSELVRALKGMTRS